MSQGRSWASGEKPDYVFIVTNGRQYRLYDKIGTARSERTRMNKLRRSKDAPEYKVLSAAPELWGEES